MGKVLHGTFIAELPANVIFGPFSAKQKLQPNGR